jgi:hypothetical protein
MTKAWPRVLMVNQLFCGSQLLKLRMVVLAHLLLSRYAGDLLFCGCSKSQVVVLAYAQIVSGSRPDR